MSIIKEIVSFFKDDGRTEQDYTLNEVYNQCDNVLDKINGQLTNTQNFTVSELLEIENNLKNQRSKLFNKCCEIRELDKFNDAFCVYRDFLAKYNNVLSIYNKSLKEICNDEIKDITNDILIAYGKLLPINNENINLHLSHHNANKIYYTQIEKLEEKRQKLLLGIIQ